MEVRDEAGPGKNHTLGRMERAAAHSCSSRFSSSISSASTLSLPTRLSILRTACSTVVWSRPPKRRPISGSDRNVKVFARYIAIWRGGTTVGGGREGGRGGGVTVL